MKTRRVEALMPVTATMIQSYCVSGLEGGMHAQTLETLEAFYTLENRAKNRENNTCDVCDEAHFWLNGYVNKQNCRIWSEANPQVYVETPLHPEKLTVWDALWAGGILLQKR
ncbi:hypothetical protein TNCV_2080081 [Trichonephila clavipes]|nr:hypothetical protein TNCV_2080081 [Trichonephila clavipes]